MLARTGAIKIAEPYDDKVRVTTRPCLECGKSHVFHLDLEKYNRWQYGGAFIQNVFPDMSIEDREILISGTCGPCFDKMFKGSGW